MDTTTEISPKKISTKLDRAQKKSIEWLIATETTSLREKLREAFSKPWGRKRSIEVNFIVTVHESLVL